MFTLKHLYKLLWWLIAGTVGGETRAKIIMALHETPMNAHQLSEKLGMDYSTIRHHLKVLEQNSLVTKMGKRYGKMYFLSDLLESNFHIFQEIWEKIGKKPKI